ncbi:MAG: TAT-variant-translocated molybdopterin oxidoreductase [Gemmataceae bacterium]|nr:TAT-variant-translocated molybdopterin oxidoreductase [Gemmataceae bacterium]
MKRAPLPEELTRDRLAPAQGKRWWQGVEEDDPAFREMVEREFPASAAELADPVSRRRFLALMGASVALAGAAGCRAPTGQILPYIRQPEGMVLGKPLFYATTMTLAGWGVGLLAESHEGRPTKLEGNTLHPASKGATSPRHQAAILGLYDPERSQGAQFRAKPRSYEEALAALRSRLGERFALLTETVGSPTLAAQIAGLAKAGVRHFVHEPVHRDNVAKGAELGLVRPAHLLHRAEKADVILSLGADFLAEGPSHLADARAFASRRRPGPEMNRLYVVECDLTVTGASADHRLPLKPSAIEGFARALAAKLGVPGAAGEDAGNKKWIDALAGDLKGRPRGRTLVIAGDGQPAAVHALAHAINSHLGNFRSTVVGIEPPLPRVKGETLAQLAAAIRAEEIDTLLVIGSNPAYSAPADVPLASALEEALRTPGRDRKSKKDWLAVHLGTHFDETARLCHWHLPQTHFLEEWSDAVAFDGTASIVQPLIAPLYDGKSAHEVVAALTRAGDSWDTRAAMEIVRSTWRGKQPTGTEFDSWWAKGLHDGVLEGIAAKDAPLVVRPDLFDQPEMRPVAPAARGYELHFAPEPGVFDGRFAGNGWLQEWPRPITRLTWDNALLVSPATAKELGVRARIGENRGGEHGHAEADLVQIEHGGRSLRAAVWAVPGHADGAATLHLGYGRTRAGKAATGAGFDAYKLRLSTASWFLPGVSITKTAGKHTLACTQGHASMEGRDLVRFGTLEEWKKDKGFATAHDPDVGFEKDEQGRKTPLTLYKKEHRYDGYKWGMAIDLSTCIGCGSCVVACQSENNSPIVGKEEVTRGREMHWLRIDRYFESKKGEPVPSGAAFQPVLCQHCEQAPCELVCPVEATVHGDEGTNDMVYNRCVGTRYCSNNCPYKVRRFNFFQYGDFTTPQAKLMHNPDVTVRSRGVMEKCTFCIQRISYARIEAAKEAMDELDLPLGKRKRRDANGEDGGPRRVDGKEVPLLRDGEVATACQSACPSDAIVFGDLNDKASRVRKLHEDARRYDLLGELGTRPRVAYLAGVRNPNPALAEEKPGGHH